MKNDIVIDYNNNTEEYNQFMRAIRNLQDLYGFQSFDNEINDLVFHYVDPDYESDDSDKYFNPYYYNSDSFKSDNYEDEFLNKIRFLESISLAKRLSSDPIKHH